MHGSELPMGHLQCSYAWQLYIGFGQSWKAGKISFAELYIVRNGSLCSDAVPDQELLSNNLWCKTKEENGLRFESVQRWYYRSCNDYWSCE